MLSVQCQEYFDQVMDGAETLGAKTLLQEQLDYLGDYACHGDPESTRCSLFYDFADLSFSFLMEKRDSEGNYQRWFNGGLIYSGPGQPSNGSGPSFTVSLDPECASGATHRWSVHT